MALKVVISFLDQPVTTGPGFSYTLAVDGYDMYYNIGTSELKVEFLPNGATPVNYYDLPIGTTLEETIQLTLDFLRVTYVNSNIYYNIVGETIEAFVNTDAVITVNPLINTYIELTDEVVEPTGVNLIYYIIYGDYTLNIYKENYSGGSTEIYGSFTLQKSAVETILEPIRGTGLQLSLEANQSLTFDEFLLSDEFTYKTELVKNDSIIFKGYIKPDGVQQSYVNDLWLINIESVDGLGLLKDLSFVQTNGTHFTGKMSFYDVIKACLDRTRLAMDINTSIEIEYNGYAGTNILKDTYVNSERFIKSSNDTVLMNCNEVLTSILNLFSGVITQQDGQWWIYRPNDLVLNGYTTFLNQTTETTFLKNLNKPLGSQINNFYPHHCDANQQIEVKGAISAYRLNYKYTIDNKGLVVNSNLNHNNDLEFDNWTVNPSLDPDILINDPLDLSGAIIKAEDYNFPEPSPFTEVMESDSFSVLSDVQLTLKFKVSTKNRMQTFYFAVVTSDGYYLTQNNHWSTDTNKKIKFNCGKLNSNIYYKDVELLTDPIPNDCTISIIIYRPMAFADIPYYPSGIGEVISIDAFDTSLNKLGVVGEFHTVSRELPPSSITKENQEVYNGDGEISLVGSIYKADQTTLTESWTRKNKNEALPILGISAMDDLRIQSAPIKVFSGGVFGEIPYMSVVTIDNVTGLFMPIEYDYDYKTNKSNIKLLQFYNSDLGDILYEISPDYGNSTIKPTIVG